MRLDLDNENPCEGILSSTMFAIRSMVHTTTKHTPSQLIFGRDGILYLEKNQTTTECKIQNTQNNRSQVSVC